MERLKDRLKTLNKRKLVVWIIYIFSVFFIAIDRRRLPIYNNNCYSFLNKPILC